MEYSKMNLVEICIITISTFLQIMYVNGQKGACSATFNGTEGEITTPGYPFYLGFNVCRPKIGVGSGYIELTFENVTLPDGSYIIIHGGISLEVGVHNVQSRVAYVHDDKTQVIFRLSQNFTGTYGGVKLLYRRIPEDVCKSNVEAQEDEGKIQSPGYPDHIKVNSTCEYNIDMNAFYVNDVIQIRFRELLFGPNDILTMYDAMDNSVILGPLTGPQRRIRAESTNTISVKIVVVTKVVSSVKQRYSILYRAVPRDSCVLDYTGDFGGKFSSLNRSCEYNIRLSTYIQLDLKFKNLYIPKMSSIKVVQKSKFLWDAPFPDLDSNDSGKMRYFRNTRGYLVITISASANTRFNVRFKRFNKDRTINLQGPNGTILSPYYPNTYLFKKFEYFTYTYHIQIPQGRVRLNFTEIHLAALSRYYSDSIYVYDGSTDSAFAIWSFEGGRPKPLPPTILGSSNHLTVKFQAISNADPEKLCRFKAFYSASELKVKNCMAFEWSHSHAERNVTLPGRKTIFLCDENYVTGTSDKDITRKCGLNGEWEARETLRCSRVCPHLDVKLKENSTLSWDYSTFSGIEVHDGIYARFFCGYYKEQLIGPKIITCTSHGNYTALPPICKRTPEDSSGDSSSNNGWKYGAGFGGALFIITVVITVLKVCFGCFSCWTSDTSVRSIPMNEVKYSHA